MRGGHKDFQTYQSGTRPQNQLGTPDLDSYSLKVIGKFRVFTTDFFFGETFHRGSFVPRPLLSFLSAHFSALTFIAISFFPRK